MKESPEQRRYVMRAVRSRNTTPERAVRQLLRSQGLSGYRLHRKELPGKPDVAFMGRRKVIFVHGCFWHGHHCPRGKRMPVNNAEYWRHKIGRNRERDQTCLAELSRLGWSVLIVWECELRDKPALIEKLVRFVNEPSIDSNQQPCF
ncbi:MAG: very short patch repair endonuclease [Zoogloeaceae bacterium]|jgi:DNA mismatch endonuclease (patch repair protein)|nr:very short patch repair endonuclease [Zoogloeaceae bacterium]